jgi:hypothetical protein
MNRLVRIALTLFISATIMVFLINRRLQALPKVEPGNRLPDSELTQIQNEVVMINFGFVLIGAMILAGLALIITAIIRNRKKPAPAAPNSDG